MKRTKMMINRIIHPPKWVLCGISLISYTELIFIFVSGKTESALAYVSYFMSAYSLVVICVALPPFVVRVKSCVQNSRIMKWVLASQFGGKYLSDLTFRGTISIYQGATVNFIYTVFRIVLGICYTSVWFISMAVYYLVLGLIRSYLIFAYEHGNRTESICYRNTAWCLLLLNIPMGGMIVLMIRTNSGFSYPGYVIYACAFYTFYTFIMAIRNLVKFRRVGSPILSASKVLNLIAAMMSILGLQTAMIAQFSANDEDFRRLMNSITGGFVYGFVIIIAAYMLLHYRRVLKGDGRNEQK